jgi:OPT oligopeptide transporter protein
VLDSSLRLNKTAYAEYSPPYISATFSLAYSIGFCLATSVLVHIALHHGPTILARLKNLRTEDEDVHMKLMRNYPEVPDWWYACWLLLFIGLAIIAIEVG